MKNRTYGIVTNVSLLLIAASALLFDRFPQRHILFGITAIVCGLVSAWTYLSSINKKEDENAHNPQNKNEVARVDRDFDVVQVKHDFAVGHARVKPPIFYGGTAQLDAVLLDKASMSEITLVQYVSTFAEAPRHRSFADEVIDIVKGLSGKSSHSPFEFEFKPDGTFRILPCSPGYGQEEQEEVERQLEDAKSRPPVFH
jgi:hypothetical protein